MRKIFVLFCVLGVLALIGVEADKAEAKGSSFSSARSSSSSSSSFKSSSPSKSSSGSYKSSNKSSASKSNSSKPKYTASNPKPQTYKGKSYTPPPKTAKFKSNPYYSKKGFGHEYHSMSNFWMWAFLFHSADTEDCDQEDLRNGDPDCQYEYEYAGEPNNDFGGYVIAFLLIGAVSVGGILAWNAVKNR